MMWPSRRTGALLAGALLLGGAYAYAANEDPAAAGDGATASAPAAVPAPDMAFETLRGARASLSDYRGQVVLLNIWGTWCPPCIREIPHLVQVQAAIEPRGGTVIGLAVDSGSPDAIDAFWRDRLELEPAYPIWMGTNRDARRHFDAFGLPNTLIIDRDGMIRERFLGLVTRELLLEALETYL
jgi:thiol-disulfide isomerase/thioredoxin